MNLSSGYWDDNISWINVIVILGICITIFLLGTSVEDRLENLERIVNTYQCYCDQKVAE